MNFPENGSSLNLYILKMVKIKFLSHINFLFEFLFVDFIFEFESKNVLHFFECAPIFFCIKTKLQNYLLFRNGVFMLLASCKFFKYVKKACASKAFNVQLYK